MLALPCLVAASVFQVDERNGCFRLVQRPRSAQLHLSLAVGPFRPFTHTHGQERTAHDEDGPRHKRVDVLPTCRHSERPHTVTDEVASETCRLTITRSSFRSCLMAKYCARCIVFGSGRFGSCLSSSSLTSPWEWPSPGCVGVGACFVMCWASIARRW